MIKHRVDRGTGPAGVDLPGQPARQVARRHRRVAGVCATLTVVAAGGLVVAGLRVTSTDALYTSTAPAQHDTITAGLWSPSPTADALGTDTSAQSLTVGSAPTDTTPPSPTEAAGVSDTLSPSPAATPSPPLECGDAGQYVSVIYGTSGDDTLYGSDQRHIIMSLGGDDTIYGGNNGDCLVGGDGNDKLYGGTQNDVLIAANGTVAGTSAGEGSSQDLLDGGSGYDACIADGGVVTESNCEAAR